jgi:hypothetical protein
MHPAAHGAATVRAGRGHHAGRDVREQQPGFGNQRSTDRTVVEEGAGAATPLDHPAENQRLGGIALDASRRQRRPDGVTGWNLERSRDFSRVAPGPDQPLPAASAKRKGERRHQDGLARPGLARERGETLAQLNREMAHQNEVADRQSRQHVSTPVYQTAHYHGQNKMGTRAMQIAKAPGRRGAKCGGRTQT